MTSFTAFTLSFVQRLPHASRKMASDRIVKFTGADIKSFTEGQDNVNTTKKTLCELKLFNN